MLSDVKYEKSWYRCYCGYKTKTRKSRLVGKLDMVIHGIIKHLELKLDVLLWG